MFDYLDAIPSKVRPAVAKLTAHVIRCAAELGARRWGATPYEEGFRVNVGWTEILTASSDDLTLHAPDLVFDTAIAADQALRRLKAQRPELADAVVVVPSASLVMEPA